MHRFNMAHRKAAHEVFPAALPAAEMSAAIDVQSVRYRTASAMSWIVEGRPKGDRLSITSFGVSR